MKRMVQLVCAVALLLLPISVAASSYYGKVTFNGLPVPGATITATQAGERLTAITDAGGVFRFADLKDGAWKIEIRMQFFATIDAQITVAPKMPAGSWELTPLPMTQLVANAQKEPAATEVAQLPALARLKTPGQQPSQGVATEGPKEPPEQDDRSADGLLVNGSVNNSATSVYSTNPAFGNSRTNSRALYNGGFAAVVDNSAIDARPFSLSGVEAPKNSYTHLTAGFTLGGPLNIPHLMPRGPNFFVGYVWTRINNAAVNQGLVPTLAQRSGDLSDVQAPIYNPATGLQYSNNQVPVSPQAQALLNLFPLPNPNIPISSGYNYQASVLNSVHQDSMNSRLARHIGTKDNIYGGYNFESTRYNNVNLFGFVDNSAALGMNANVHWMHRYTPHLFVTTTYTFGRTRTRRATNFGNRVNISGNAGIGGNDQDPADWGPPALNFTSGFTGLNDGNSEYNRNRSDEISVSAYLYQGKHNFTGGFDFTKEDFNWFAQQNPRGGFSFTGAATSATGSVTPSSGSDLADFLVGIPDTSAIAYGNADKYFREPLFDAYLNDDWRMTPTLTLNAGVRWQYSAPMTELKGRLVNLDINPDFSAAVPVLASDPVGSVTGQHYPESLMRPDWSTFEPRIGIAWRPIPASSVVIRAGYGIWHDTSVYLRIASQLAQQAPLSKSLSVQNSAACPLTLADGFPACSATTSDTFAVDPNFRVGYSQIWNLSVQRDLPFAMQITGTYTGTKGTHGSQALLPNSYPIGEANPCPGCPSGFVYEISGGNSTRHAGELQLRRRLMNGFSASVDYTYSKSIDDDAYLGGTGHVTASVPGQVPSQPASGSGAIAQNWLNPHAERSLSTFDQRQLVKIEGQYTTGEGLGGHTLMSGWRGRLLKEWTLTTNINAGTGFPETPIFPAPVPGTGVNNTIRPDLTGASIYSAGQGRRVNASAYAPPEVGHWGTAGRDSITGPGQFALDSALARTFRPHGKLYLDLTVSATNLLNHPEFTSWNTLWAPSKGSNAPGNLQFGLPASAGAMRSLQTVLRLRF
ncbi:MAG TPA: carboxypeptidase regulatory-like domain-containing protein [Terracidiphilus sp.]|nr:carboxypeptidase regulatory-like domain-containing protein [Terracidiphilus sp.]